ncbi:MAG: C_GCAxxG_C_C family protein [Bacteroidales bacterium]|nr:C_GCAxxG_C_C family protein [Bacteroidales bacterium]
MDQKKIDERVALARSLFKQGYNCSQSVVMAFEDITGLAPEVAAKASCGFGAGVGRMREVCGCVSGMAFVSGFLRPMKSADDAAGKSANYEFVQSLASQFKAVTGSIICREMLGLGAGPSAPQPAERNAAYYKKRPCEETVALATKILAETIEKEATAS